MDAQTARKIDFEVLDEAAKRHSQDMNLLFDMSKDGISEVDLEARIFQLRDLGYITIFESIGQTTVTGITQSGQVYLKSIRANNIP